jgi:hypothetical protein
MDFASEFKRFFRQGGALTQLILINITSIFPKIWVSSFSSFNRKIWNSLLLQFLALPADPGRLLVRPWTILTYMFLHYDLLHILFNMLWLFWFGTNTWSTECQEVVISLSIRGLSGGLFYVLAYNLFPAFADRCLCRLLWVLRLLFWR